MGKKGEVAARGRRYEEAYKLRVVRRVLAGESPEEVARALGAEGTEAPSIVSIRNWSQDKRLRKKANRAAQRAREAGVRG